MNPDFKRFLDPWSAAPRSLALGGKSQKQTSNQTANSERQPWAPTIPQLTDFLSDLEGASSYGETEGQTAAFDALTERASAGNPYAGDIADLASSLFGAESRAGQVGAAFDQLSTNIGDFASGSAGSNPEIDRLLGIIADDTHNRINRQYAAAGRDLSPSNARAVARGVTEATAPILVNQYNTDVDRQLGAARSLYDAAVGGATTQAGLDAAALDTRSQGVGVAQDALAARDYGENAVLELGQQRKSLPLTDLAQIAELLFGAANLGGTESGASSGSAKTKGSSFGLGVNLQGS